MLQSHLDRFMLGLETRLYEITLLRTEAGALTSLTCSLLLITFLERQQDLIRRRSARHVGMGVVPAS
jgi:hypothetical protein